MKHRVKWNTHLIVKPNENPQEKNNYLLIIILYKNQYLKKISTSVAERVKESKIFPRAHHTYGPKRYHSETVRTGFFSRRNFKFSG